MISYLTTTKTKSSGNCWHFCLSAYFMSADNHCHSFASKDEWLLKSVCIKAPAAFSMLCYFFTKSNLHLLTRQINTCKRIKHFRLSHHKHYTQTSQLHCQINQVPSLLTRLYGQGNKPDKTCPYEGQKRFCRRKELISLCLYGLGRAGFRFK